MVKKITYQDFKKWTTVYKKTDKKSLQTSFLHNRLCTIAKDEFTATSYDNFLALAIAVRDRIVENWILTQQRYHRKNVKRVYYLSLEFLLGKMLITNILNLKIYPEVKKALKELGLDLDIIAEEEAEAALGNGGLGRLAACFLDSLASLGIPAQGYGIRYDYGIFRQKIVNGYQVELPEEWLSLGNPWEFARPEYTVPVKFYGHTESFWDARGKFCVAWVDTEDVLAVAYDIPIVGYGNKVVNTLRLWSARSSKEFDLEYFNDGDYEKAVYKKVYSENISKVLYPNDAVSAGKELRLKQEYFLVAATISDIIRRFKVENKDIRKLPQKAVIHLNDTHPSLAIAELMRKLVDEENLTWEESWEITRNCFAYTNHTVMPEALEKWPVPLLERMLPRHLQIIYEINRRFLREVANKFPLDTERLTRVSLIEETNPKNVRMANLSIVGSSSVNGVSQLHTEILKKKIFKDFFEIYPERFNNKTNGITQRRWLLKANRLLSSFITETISDAWINNLYELEKLLPFLEDSSFQQSWEKIKYKNKVNLSNYIFRTTHLSVDPASLFDVQIKRIHEYKRQLLFCFYIIQQYLKIKEGKEIITPRTFIFAGKAAPAYFMAKLIIKFINNVAEVINQDPQVKDRLRIVFLENYSVSLAEKIFPAAELSEQISCAGFEASGTGCMKSILNGAITIGTEDGANIEIARCVGEENIFTFGLKAEEIEKMRPDYYPCSYIENSYFLKKIFDLIEKDFFSPVESGLFKPLLESLRGEDRFFVCADFQSYCKMQEVVSENYQNRDSWIKKSIINTAKSGYFSSDRTIGEYAKEIWRV